MSAAGQQPVCSTGPCHPVNDTDLNVGNAVDSNTSVRLDPASIIEQSNTSQLPLIDKPTCSIASSSKTPNASFDYPVRRSSVACSGSSGASSSAQA